MPIDPRIALQVQGIEVPNIGNAYERFMNNRARREAMEQNKQLHAAQMAEVQQRTQGRVAEAQRQQKVGEVLAGGGKAQDVMAIDPDLGIKLAGEERAAQKAEADAAMAKYNEQLKELEVREKKLSQLSSLAGSITDDASLAVGISQAIRLGLPDDVAMRMLKAGYTPETAAQLKQFQAQGLSAKEQLDQERQNIQLEIQRAEEARKKEAFPLQQKKLQNEVITGTPNAAGLTPAQQAQETRAGKEFDALQVYRRNSLAMEQRRIDATKSTGQRTATQQQTTNEAKLRDDFNNAAKPFKAVSEAFSRVASAEGDKGVNDIALIFGYMKMLDPGSVVREGEFATAQNSAGIPDRISTMYNNALRGAKLSPQQRQEMKQQASELYKAAEEDHQQVEKQFREISERSGVNPLNVVIDYRSRRAKGGGGSRPPLSSFEGN